MALTKERIVRAALDLLDDTGLDGLTLRLLAARLGVKAPALYWHVASKADLLDEMATMMLHDLLTDQVDSVDGAEPAVDWREMMTTAATQLRRMMLSRRDGAKVFAGTYPSDRTTAAASQGPMRVLTAAGFAPPDAVHAWQTLSCFVVGFAIEEQSVRQPSGDADGRFAFGVRTVVAGLATVLDGETCPNG